MKTLFLAIALVILTNTAVSQVSHAPTVAQCQADQRLWLSKLETSGSHRLTETFSTLTEWRKEMFECRAVDPPNQIAYYNTGSETSEEMSSRKSDFIRRHGMMSQFYAEDEAGER
jgi:hypothetical protein